MTNVVVTTAGKMKKQKYVYHSITIDKKRRLQIHLIIYKLNN